MQKETNRIMQALASKKGLMGILAEMYVNNEEKAMQFIRECSEQLHNESTRKYWGEELCSEILLFCKTEVISPRNDLPGALT